MRKGRQYSDAVRLFVGIRHVVGFDVRQTQAFLLRFGIGTAWVERCVRDLRARDPLAHELHRGNHGRGSSVGLAGIQNLHHDVRSSEVTDISTGYTLVSVRGDLQGRQTLAWITRQVATEYAHTGAAVRLYRRKPFLSPKHELTLATMETDRDALRLILYQLGENPLYEFERSRH